jgi:serine/threonine protein kinase
MIIGGQYKIVSELGRGGMGVVYQGVDMVLEREVAIKKLRSEFSQESHVSQRFLREAKIQADLDHSNITPVYASVQHADTFYIVMKFVDGTPLNRLIPLPYELLLPLMLQALDGLEFAHNLGVLHRDIKPDNLMVTPTGSLQIMDFGIAHVLGSSRQTREKTIMGTLEYISPERITGKDPDRRSDIYALGAVLYEALTGKPPFESKSEYELLRQHMEEEPPRLRQTLPQYPEFLETTILRALAKNPDERFATCRQMKEALSAGMAQLAISLHSGVLPQRDMSDEIERCGRRIMALAQSGEGVVAQRVLNRARTYYPGQGKFEAIQGLLDQELGVAPKPAIVDRRVLAADILQQILSWEEKGDWKAACDLAMEAQGKYPDIRAFHIAALYLQGKAGEGDHA